MQKHSTQVFIVSGPSGSGKTTVVQRLLEDVPNLFFGISCTTRAPRPGEQDTREYYFVGRDDFEKMIVRDEFLEYASVFGELYGTPRKMLQQAQRQGKDLLLDIDVQGARQVKSKIPDAVAILLIPPSAGELQNRLRSRGQDSPEVIQRRLERAQEEIQSYQSYDYLVVNSNVGEASSKVADIVGAKRGSGQATERVASLRKDANPEQISAILETFGAKTG